MKKIVFILTLGLFISTGMHSAQALVTGVSGGSSPSTGSVGSFGSGPINSTAAKPYFETSNNEYNTKKFLFMQMCNQNQVRIQNLEEYVGDLECQLNCHEKSRSENERFLCLQECAARVASVTANEANPDTTNTQVNNPSGGGCSLNPTASVE